MLRRTALALGKKNKNKNKHKHNNGSTTHNNSNNNNNGKKKNKNKSKHNLIINNILADMADNNINTNNTNNTNNARSRSLASVNVPAHLRSQQPSPTFVDILAPFRTTKPADIADVEIALPAAPQLPGLETAAPPTSCKAKKLGKKERKRLREEKEQARALLRLRAPKLAKLKTLPEQVSHILRAGQKSHERKQEHQERMNLRALRQKEERRPKDVEHAGLLLQAQQQSQATAEAREERPVEESASQDVPPSDSKESLDVLRRDLASQKKELDKERKALAREREDLQLEQALQREMDADVDKRLRLLASESKSGGQSPRLLKQGSDGGPTVARLQQVSRGWGQNTGHSAASTLTPILLELVQIVEGTRERDAVAVLTSLQVNPTGPETKQLASVIHKLNQGNLFSCLTELSRLRVFLLAWMAGLTLKPDDEKGGIPMNFAGLVRVTLLKHTETIDVDCYACAFAVLTCAGLLSDSDRALCSARECAGAVKQAGWTALDDAAWEEIAFFSTSADILSDPHTTHEVLRVFTGMEVDPNGFHDPAYRLGATDKQAVTKMILQDLAQTTWGEPPPICFLPRSHIMLPLAVRFPIVVLTEPSAKIMHFVLNKRDPHTLVFVLSVREPAGIPSGYSHLGDVAVAAFHKSGGSRVGKLQLYATGKKKDPRIYYTRKANAA